MVLFSAKFCIRLFYIEFEVNKKITGYNGDCVERIVKRHTGKTLSAYGRDFLIQKTAELLRDTDLSIAEICERQGDSNRYYFNKIFAEKYGMKPSEFRRQYRSKEVADTGRRE